MPASPTIDRSVVTPIVGTMDVIASDLEPLLESANLLRLWSDPSVTELPEDRVWQLFECASRKHGCPAIGLHAGEKLQIQDLGQFGMQLRNSLTLFQCLTRYNQTVSQYSSHASFWLEQQGDAFWFCRQGIDLIDSGRDYVEQFTIQLMIRIVQLATGPDWRPSQIRIQASTDEFFRDDPGFDNVEIASAKTVTSIRIPIMLVAQTLEVGPEFPLHQQINRMLEENPDRYQMHIDDAALTLGVSRRTLQRYLGQQGANWRGTVEQFRFREAIQLMAEPDIKLVNLAHELGYTDQANFGRAFRKWTGLAPGNYRKMYLT